MRFINLSSILLASLLLAACGDNIEVYPDTTEAQAIVVDGACPGVAAQIASARLEGTSLVVTARYGGCAQTRIWACWDGELGTGDPATADIVVHALPAGDCDALHENSAAISLDPVLADRPLMIRAGAFDLLWRP